MGCPTTVFVEITLSGQADEVLEAFEREVARVPDVLECHLMAGKSDYLLKVVAENTEDFARIHRQYLARCPACKACSQASPCAPCSRRRPCRFRGGPGGAPAPPCPRLRLVKGWGG